MKYEKSMLNDGHDPVVHGHGDGIEGGGEGVMGDEQPPVIEGESTGI